MLTGDPYADALAKAANVVQSAIAALHAPKPTTTTPAPLSTAPASGLPVGTLLLGGLAVYLLVKGMRR